MKVVLKSGSEFTASSVFMQSENELCISFTGITSYDTLRTSLTIAAMKEIKYYMDETSFTSYENFTKFKAAKIIEVGDGTLEIVVLFEREDEISQRISQNEEDIAALYDGFNVLMTEIIPSLMV
jgi:hypothetical protein